MKSKKNALILVLLMFFSGYPVLLPNDFPGPGLSFAQGRRRDHRSYRNYRHYPSQFFYHRKLYYSPGRRYYFYYEFYPNTTYYYDWEKKQLPDNPNYLPITSIANMSSQGVPDSVIISEIDRTHSKYKLTSETITYLKQNNASDRLIDYMLSTGKQ